MSPDRLTDMKRVYDQQAPDFAKKAPTLLTWEFIGKPTIEKFIDQYFPQTDNVFALDIGSATGRVVRILEDKGVRAKNITGVEISPEEVKIAKQNIPDADFKVGDIRKIKLPANKFDLVTCSMVLEFLDEKGLDQALNNIYDSMKPEGKLIYISTHPKRVEGKYNLNNDHRGWFETGGPWGGKFKNWHRSINDYIQQTKNTGFEILTTEELGMPEKAAKKYPDKIKEYKSFDAPARLVVVARKF